MNQLQFVLHGSMQSRSTSMEKINLKITFTVHAPLLFVGFIVSVSRLLENVCAQSNSWLLQCLYLFIAPRVTD